jgi:RNA polymerase sigma-70 factor (ECF subfamily)
MDAARTVVEVDERDGQALLGFAIRLGLTADEADDAVQEALLRLYRELAGGATIREPRAWTFRTLYRLAMDGHRLRRRLEALRARFSRSTASHGDLADVASRLTIWAAVDRLPDRQRQVLYLRYKADLAFEEAAHIMGITPAGARAVAARGIAALRGAIPEEDRP